MEAIYQMDLFANHEKAIALINEYLELESDSERKSSAHIILGEANFRLKEWQDAISHYSFFLLRTDYMKLAMEDQTNENGFLFSVIKALVGRGVSKASLKDFKGALADLDEGISLIEIGLKDRRNKEEHFFKKREMAHFVRGTIRIGYKTDLDGACDDLRIAGELGNAQAYKLIESNCN